MQRWTVRCAGGVLIRTSATVLTLLCLMAALSGCLYPKDQLVQNQMPAKDAILNIQTVVNQYFADTGMLPIVTPDADTPKYEKYRIDFAKLKGKNYISAPPSYAFEGGGHYYYLIINEESSRQVKLMDIAIFQKVSDIQREVNEYYKRDSKMVSLNGDQVYPGFYRINFDLLGMKEPEIKSVYSGRTISPMIDERGYVYLDYAFDMMQAVQKSGMEPKEDDDLRELLAQSSDLVPVKSPLYRFVNGEPQAQQEN
ncbi:hypothetical protein [Paenibacillus xylaniclasticus]|uniref:hypothetical protein n=1 Tax=Paenibacillus xylaniclasticus TaxID=588083 RepID=UPI000FD97F58|nr:MULTISPECIES: hypothetical protein [Paenibacillus]GFN30634.1 hypothetical protein PCURB6_08940 [Paenibacillus curdlanolyticus]